MKLRTVIVRQSLEMFVYRLNSFKYERTQKWCLYLQNGIPNKNSLQCHLQLFITVLLIKTNLLKQGFCICSLKNSKTEQQHYLWSVKQQHPLQTLTKSNLFMAIFLNRTENRNVEQHELRSLLFLDACYKLLCKSRQLTPLNEPCVLLCSSATPRKDSIGVLLFFLLFSLSASDRCSTRVLVTNSTLDALKT